MRKVYAIGLQRYMDMKFRFCGKDLILAVFHPWSHWRLLDTNKQTDRRRRFNKEL